MSTLECLTEHSSYTEHTCGVAYIQQMALAHCPETFNVYEACT